MRALFLVSVTLLAASFSNGENLGIPQLRTSEAEAYPCGQPANQRELHPFSRGRESKSEKQLCDDLKSRQRSVAELDSSRKRECNGRNPWDQRCSRATVAVDGARWYLKHSEEACKCLSAPSGGGSGRPPGFL